MSRQYYSNSTGCSAYCPIVSNGPTGSDAMALATVCTACAVTATTTNAAATSTNAAIGIPKPDAASWKIVFTIGAILSIEPFGGFLI
ncbi:hypothetical protein J3F84DRAFT_398976 [Trichoderma pleuroticola]